ncbi:glutamate synthase large subunit-like protein YerD [Lentibacillus kapialis]|uniref:Glutamate synthase large subunit-like protein YerD n=1 Tax=Lentibacillus kapialis TaxID=340214 RepID=A0A917PVZ1_9BACI|nr:FMN-binding glutamate synthase family protein [Lentibacillus kapialis]GGJ95239.1 glutamate synthase large subunit-like protein YerD [Lentibacillus kapialis]
MLVKWFVIGILILLALVILVPAVLLLRLYFHDVKQKEHSVLQNYPILGRMRYILEKMGPELRQYLFLDDMEGKPFNRKEFEFVAKAGKYNSSMMGFGAERNFEDDGFYLVNHMFPAQKGELKVTQSPKVKTHVYEIDKENLFSRKEKSADMEVDPSFLHEDDNVVLGEHTVRHPFRLKGLIGQSAMSYGSLGDHAITALSKGLGMAGGTWMNTGEGSVSPYHLKGNTDIIMQISPGLFGVRDKAGYFSWEEFKKQAETEQIRAFELKLAQGAKTRGGHVSGNKVTEEIANIRKVEVGKDINSPNRFPGISNSQQLLSFLSQLREVSGKPIGIKLVAGDEQQVDQFIKAMADSGIVPDFITVDGGEGGTGASYYALAYSVGLPSFSAIPLVDEALKKYGVRDRTRIIASGKLLTPDKIAMALCLGADLINIARGFMIATGCIMAQVCHTNTCPVGVATTDENLQKALNIEEKKYRVANYLITLRNDLFNLAAVVGLDSPTKFNRDHLVYRSAFKEFANPNNQLADEYK